jgi:diguanylate cyclase (GGDEF)-like protein/PAS domain S-box-containing protein
MAGAPISDTGPKSTAPGQARRADGLRAALARLVGRAGLRLRLMLLTALIVLPPAALNLAQQARETEQLLHDAERAMEQLAGGAAARHVVLLAQIRTLMETAARLPDVGEIRDAEACNTVLEQIGSSVPGLRGMAMLNPVGGPIRCSSHAGVLGMTVPDHAFIRQALATGEFTVSDLVQGQVVQGPQIATVLPLARDGAPQRALIALIDTGWLAGLLGTDARHGRTIQLVDSRGVVAAQWPLVPDRVGKPVADPALRARLAERNAGMHRTLPDDGEPRIYGFAPLPGTGAMLVAEQEAAAVLAPSRRARLQALAVPLVFALLAVLLAWTIGDRLLIRSLNRIAAAARDGGSIAAAAPRAAAPPEVRNLHAALAALEARSAADRAALVAAEAASRRQAELFGSVTAALPKGLAAFDAQGRLITSNRRYQEMLGLPDRLLVPGVHYLDLARSLASRGEYGPGDPEMLAGERWRRATCGRPYRFSRSRPGGMMLDIAGQPLPGGGFLVTFQDVTERTAREAALRESEASFRLLAEHAGDVVTRAGLDGVWRYVSPAAARILGWEPAALIGRSVHEVIHPEDQPWLDAVLDALRGGETEAKLACRVLRGDGGGEIWIEATARLPNRGAAAGAAEFVAVLRDASERKAAERQLLAAYERMEEMAATDALTGLANRRRFDEVLEKEWRRSAREGAALSLLLLDADGFKLFNDTYGHAAGDGALRAIAVAMEAEARRPGDLPARLGGEEFALLMPGTEATGAAHVAERIRARVEAAGVPHSGSALGVLTISGGMATVWPQMGTGPGMTLLEKADAQLYAAKRAGRNIVLPLQEGQGRSSAPALRLMQRAGV